MQKPPESVAKTVGNDVFSLLKQNMNDQLRCELQKLLWTKADQAELEGAVISIAEVSRNTEDTKDGPVIYPESEPKSDSEDSEDDDGDSSAMKKSLLYSCQLNSQKSHHQERGPVILSGKRPRKRGPKQTPRFKRLKTKYFSLPSEGPRNEPRSSGKLITSNRGSVMNDVLYISYSIVYGIMKSPLVDTEE